MEIFTLFSHLANSHLTNKSRSKGLILPGRRNHSLLCPSTRLMPLSLYASLYVIILFPYLHPTVQGREILEDRDDI